MSYAWCAEREAREGVCDGEEASCASTPPTIPTSVLVSQGALCWWLVGLHKHGAAASVVGIKVKYSGCWGGGRGADGVDAMA
jgi:hypothetical protein